MTELDDLLNFIYKLEVKQKDAKKVTLDKALNKILACDIFAKYDIPRFDNSAMDGFALRLNKDFYTIKGNAFAGGENKLSIKNNEAILITTGARIPQGAEAVLQKELCLLKDDKLFLNLSPKKGQNIKFKGEDFKKGRLLLKKGTRLNSQNIAILASQGFHKIDIVKKIKIIIFSSGNEISKLSSSLKENQIYDINSYFLKSVLKEIDNSLVSIRYGGILNDNENEISNILEKYIQKYDIVITSGGASVGDADYMHKVLKSINAKILIDSLNIKPGRPVVLSQKNNNFILTLPGNPIGAFINFLFFVPLLVQKMSKSKDLYFESFSAINKSEFKVNPKTSNVILGNFIDGEFFAYNKAKYQGAQVSPLVKSNSLAIFKNKSTIKKNSKIQVLLYKMQFLDKINKVIN